LKTEPDEFSWQRLAADGVGHWDGVRNYAARNHLRQMKLGDWAFIYHTGKTREIVGVAQVVREHYPDVSALGKDFSAVDVAPLAPLSRAVTLQEIKAAPGLGNMSLVTMPRLSVQPVTDQEFRQVLGLGKTTFSSLVK
jgi:predicted RNA-binding protein with PUA-like domain